MHEFWEQAVERLQYVLTALPDIETKTGDERIKAQLADAEPSANDEIKPFLRSFAEMSSQTFSDVVVVWRDKYQR